MWRERDLYSVTVVYESVLQLISECVLNSVHVTEQMLAGSLSEPREENQRAPSSALAARKPATGQDGKWQFLLTEKKW